jgi:PncC family amidohydrolase
MEMPLSLAAEVGALLKARKQTISVAESASGGLMSAALLSVPGASAYFLGGAAIYTRRARRVLMDMPDKLPEGMVSATEPYALLLARTARSRLSADWGLAETGAAGPTGNSKGDPAGHACIAVVGPSGEKSITVRTGQSDRPANMEAFTVAALELLLACLKD